MHSGEILNTKYEIVSRISLKGYRQKWLATDKSNNNKVVLETLHDDLMNNPSAIDSLRYELQVSQKLEGDVFQKCIDTFLHKDKLFLVWQHYDYEPLSIALNGIVSGIISDSQKLDFVSKISRGINHAHSLNIIHGRINGENILVDPKLHPKIINFSSNQMYENTDPGGNSILSSKHLIAPEIINGERPDRLTDFYSIGIIAKVLFLNNASRENVDLRTLRLLHLRRDIDPVIANVIDGLSSSDRGLREVAIEKLLDDNFLSSMNTPPSGVPIVKVSRFKSRKIIKRHKRNNNDS